MTDERCDNCELSATWRITYFAVLVGGDVVPCNVEVCDKHMGKEVNWLRKDVDILELTIRRYTDPLLWGVSQPEEAP